MWRSLLFVPVLNNRLVEGAARRGADAVVLDLEAAVPQDRKEEARAALANVVPDLKVAGLDIAVRVNPPDEGGIGDIAAAIEVGVDLIVLPQATPDWVRQAAGAARATPVIPLVESPRGVIDALAIAEAAPTVVGLGFGVEDYATEMGAPPTPDLLVPAACQVIQAARAAGCEPLVIADTIADYTDLKRFEAAAVRARASGASGGFAIHPGQVEILNRIFMPSDEEFREAQEVIALAKEASHNGDAIATLNGKMIDAPIVARARSVIAARQRIADRSSPAKKTFLLLHGAFHGGWCWEKVASNLRRNGSDVYTPTFTGAGERSHLLSSDVTLETWVEDIANVIEYEQLEDVILVAHSFGGITAMSIADRMPEKLRHLVFLDAVLVNPGHSAFDERPEAARDKARKAAAENGGLAVPPPPLSIFGVSDEAIIAEVAPKLTAHPIAAHEEKVTLQNPLLNGVRATYISCTEPLYEPLNPSRDIAQASGAKMLGLETGHEAMFTAPDELSLLLSQIE